MAIRDHVDPKLRKRLSAQRPREPEPRKSKRSRLKLAFLAVRLMIFFIALLLLNEVFGLNLLEWLLGSPEETTAGTDSTSQIVEDAALQWIDETIILVVMIALAGAIAGLLLAKWRARSSTTITTLMQSDKSSPSESAPPDDKTPKA